MSVNIKMNQITRLDLAMENILKPKGILCNVKRDE